MTATTALYRPLDVGPARPQHSPNGQ